MSLKTEEARLLALLLTKENEASRLLLAYEEAQRQLDVIRLDLEDIREKLLKEFLDEHLTSLSLSYTIKTDITGEALLSIIPLDDGQLEFDKLKSSLNITDTNNIPLFSIIAYLGKGLPYG